MGRGPAAGRGAADPRAQAGGRARARGPPPERGTPVAVLELELPVAAPRARCFDLARSVDAHVRSTRHFGLALTLTSRITAFDRPNHFRDEMVRGPLARMTHDHHFLDDGRGGTLIRERFDFASPLGLLGRIADACVLTRYFRRFLELRNAELERLAVTDGWRELLREVPVPCARAEDPKR